MYISCMYILYILKCMRYTSDFKNTRLKNTLLLSCFEGAMYIHTQYNPLLNTWDLFLCFKPPYTKATHESISLIMKHNNS